MKLIGLSGTNGSGKDTVGAFLAESFGYCFISVTNTLRGEVTRRGLPIQRENTRMVSTEWRKEFGLAVLVDKALEEFSKDTASYKGLVISSLRNPGEADRIHELGGIVVWVDADSKIRYERVVKRLRSTDDQKTYEQFRGEEKAEITHSGDATTLNMSAVKLKSDIFLENSGDSIAKFKEKVEQSLLNYL